MANKIFYVDPANGSNDNDGSAPDKAWADVTPALSTDDSTADAPALIYVRRSGDQTFADDVDWSANPNRIIIGWPNEGDPYYDVRPQDGQDAGWDEGVVDLPKITINKGVDAKNTTASILGFYNLNIETSDDGTDLAIQYSIGDVSIENCIINHQRDDDSDSFISFHRIDDTNGIASLTVKNSNISFDGMLFGCRDDVTWTEVDFNFNSENNSYEATDNGYAIWYWRASGTTQNINSDNDKVSAHDKNSRFVYENGDNNNLAVVTITINNMDFDGSYFIYGKQRYKLTLKIDNSNVIANKDDGIIVWIHNDNLGIDYKTDLYINNSYLNGNRVLYINNNRYNSDNSSVGDIEINNCEIEVINEVIRFYSDINIYSEKLTINNNKINATSIISSNYDNESFKNTYINIYDSVLSDNVCYHVKNYSLFAKNSSFSQLSNSSYPDGVNQINLVNCKVTNGSYQNDLIQANGCEISGEFRYGKLEFYDCKVTLDSSMNAVFKNCTTSDFPATINKEMEFFSCVVNDNPIPYAKLTKSFRIEPSNVVRVNGNNGSLKVQNATGLYSFNINRLKFVKLANKTKAVLYLASQGDTGSLFNYTLILNYTIDKEAYVYVSPTTAITASTEEWSGLYDGYKSYKLEFDVPKHDTDINLEVELLGTNNSTTYPTAPIYVDLKTNWE